MLSNDVVLKPGYLYCGRRRSMVDGLRQRAEYC